MTISEVEFSMHEWKFPSGRCCQPAHTWWILGTVSNIYLSTILREMWTHNNLPSVWGMLQYCTIVLLATWGRYGTQTLKPLKTDFFNFARVFAAIRLAIYWNLLLQVLCIDMSKSLWLLLWNSNLYTIAHNMSFVLMLINKSCSRISCTTQYKSYSSLIRHWVLVSTLHIPVSDSSSLFQRNSNLYTSTCGSTVLVLMNQCAVL